MKKKLTPWFSDGTKPHHVGYYDTKWLMGLKPRRRYWDGFRWLVKEKGEPLGLQCHFWRGLAQRPV